MPKSSAIIPEAMKAGYHDDFHMSPAILHDQFIFLTGMTGVNRDGTISADAETQFRRAFEKVKLILGEANCDMSHIVELTSYHVNIHDHIEAFKMVHQEYVVEPYPAWTAIEVSGFLTKGALVEIRCIVHK